MIFFNSLDRQNIQKISGILLDESLERLKEKNINIEIDKEVSKKIAKSGFNPKYGARPLKRTIQNEILNPLANLIIDGEISDGSNVKLTIKNNEYKFDYNKSKRNKKIAKMAS